MISTFLEVANGWINDNSGAEIYLVAKAFDSLG